MESLPGIVRTNTADLYDTYVVQNYARAPLTLVRGKGSQVWDDQGNAYLDFTSGIAVSALGHCHPQWVAAVQRQAGEIIHTSNLFRHPNQGELARRLGMPEWKLDKAQKLARFWPDEALGKAIVAVAEADEGVKGGAADAVYALERCVFKIVDARAGR